MCVSVCVCVGFGGGGVGGGGLLGLIFAGHFPPGLSEPLPHYSLLCGHIDPILVTFRKK